MGELLETAEHCGTAGQQLTDGDITTVAELKSVGSREALWRILARDPSACIMRLFRSGRRDPGRSLALSGEGTKQSLKDFYHAQRRQNSVFIKKIAGNRPDRASRRFETCAT
jgi:DNA transformation protein